MLLRESDFRGDLTYAQVLTLARSGLGVLRQAGMAILLTDFLDPQGFEGVLRELTGRRLRTLALHVVSPDEENPPLEGALRLVDRENGDARVLHVTDRVRRAYQDAFRRHARGLEAACARRRVNYLRVSTAVPFDTHLLGLLRRGGMIR